MSQYQPLRGITADAWQAVVATTKQSVVASGDDAAVASGATAVARPFTEPLLRDITSLTAEQQFWLVKSLAAGKMDKVQFKAAAEKAKARNGWRTEAARRLKDLPDGYLKRAMKGMTRAHSTPNRDTLYHHCTERAEILRPRPHL